MNPCPFGLLLAYYTRAWFIDAATFMDICTSVVVVVSGHWWDQYLIFLIVTVIICIRILALLYFSLKIIPVNATLASF
jgi:hypothetical protein